MTMPRPAFKIDSSHPGSDVAMETAAAFASGAMVFNETGTAGHLIAVYLYFMAGHTSTGVRFFC